jgi:hypothetical protein
LLGQLWSIDFLARAERDQGGKANVNAYAIWSGTIGGHHFDVKDDVLYRPGASGLPTSACSEDRDASEP